jgi:hypothetical protein
MTNFLSTTSIETEPVLMRRAAIGDAARIRELALLDDKRTPAGPFLVAELSGEIVAAVSLATGTVVADPFRPTSDAVAMLRLRAAQVSGATELDLLRIVRSGRSAAGDQSFAAAA